MNGFTCEDCVYCHHGPYPDCDRSCAREAGIPGTWDGQGACPLFDLAVGEDWFAETRRMLNTDRGERAWEGGS